MHCNAIYVLILNCTVIELVMPGGMFLPLAILLASTVVLTTCMFLLCYRFSEGAAAFHVGTGDTEQTR